MLHYEEAKALLDRAGQSHVLRFWDRLNAGERQYLLKRIEALDFHALKRMQDLLAERRQGTVDDIRPAEVTHLEGDELVKCRKKGGEAVSAGEVGVLLVAGGQGSRLGFEGPKGMFPIGPVSDATLFEIHARKVLALGRRHGANIPLYVMTSEANDEATREFFREKDHFGLSPRDVLFFVQGMWPALDDAGRMILESPGRLFMSPDGHGGILNALRATGTMEDMAERGIKTLFYFQVDNPLVEVADPAFIGIHLARRADVSIKVCAKRGPAEGLGVVVTRGGRNAIVEYSELTEQQKTARAPDGNLRFLYGSVAIHVFSFDFLAREAAVDLPLHVAHKKVPTVDPDGAPIRPTAPNAFKFEKFIFDAIPDADRAINVVFRREDEFSPVKNATGDDSPGTTKRDMTRKFGRWLTSCGVDLPRGADGNPAVALEIDPCYALDEDELRWKLPRGFAVKGDLYLS
jgi:UDP-N-acetylglucosamine/UDP-N-acetylgalactosamine diphosphorylase